MQWYLSVMKYQVSRKIVELLKLEINLIECKILEHYLHNESLQSNCRALFKNSYPDNFMTPENRVSHVLSLF
jgi:hypothetical protein